MRTAKGGRQPQYRITTGVPPKFGKWLDKACSELNRNRSQVNREALLELARILERRGKLSPDLFKELDHIWPGWRTKGGDL
jgi:hypothetical protein